MPRKTQKNKTQKRRKTLSRGGGADHSKSQKKALKSEGNGLKIILNKYRKPVLIETSENKENDATKLKKNQISLRVSRSKGSRLSRSQFSYLKQNVPQKQANPNAWYNNNK